MNVNGHCQLEIIDDPVICKGSSPFGKPFIKLTFPDGQVQCITTNLAEMIGGAGTGARKRWEDLNSGRGTEH